MPWDPEIYLKFAMERSRPFDDLLALVKERPGIEAVDLGCGTGSLTKRLAELLPDAVVTGIDSSAEMLDRAGDLTRPGLSFRQGDIANASGSWDLVVSNAALHWVDDHHSLIPRIFRLLRPGGQLVIQVPSNHRHPSHLFLAETAGEEPFRTALAGWVRHHPVLEIDAYGAILFQCGAEAINIFEKVYLHPMENADGIADWTSGTTMIPYLERLPEDLHAPFQESYRRKLRKEFPGSPVLYTFRRTFLCAFRGTD